MNTAKVVVVIPTYRDALSNDERISIRHLQRFLSGYEHVAIAAPGHKPPFDVSRTECFQKSDFESVESYNRLLLERRFYERFASYDFMLVYQLDALVFADHLQFWCDSGYDFIGAPWLTDFARKAGPNDRLWKVGNGGFSLRKVQAFLRVFTDFDGREAARLYWSEICIRHRGFRRMGRLPKLLWKLVPLKHSLTSHLSYNRSLEDVFWGTRAEKYLPGFRVAPPKRAVAFAIESDPAFCFEENGRSLPFGAHAWTRFDRDFWSPFLINEGE